MATADRLWFKPPGGEWREFPLARLAPQDSHFLVKAKDGRPIVITDNAIWRIDRGLDAVRIASMRGIQSALVRADGSAVLLLMGRVVEVKGGETRELFRVRGRPIDMVQRGRTLWVGTDTYLVAWTPGQPPEILGPEQNVPSGGPLRGRRFPERQHRRLRRLQAQATTGTPLWPPRHALTGVRCN